MTGTRTTRFATLAALAGAVLTVASVTTATAASSDASTDESRRSIAAQRPAPSGPPVNFVSVCNFSHAAADDPIVYPGLFGAAHLHQFFGNTSTDAVSTPASMAAAGTTCTRLGDTAGYWVPALYDDGVEQRPGRAQAYYTLAGKDAATIEAFPADLRIVAGGEDDPDAATRWGCLDPGSRVPLETTTTVPSCSEGTHLAARVVFPDCWDGELTDTQDHRSHLAYSVRGACPDEHPVALPRLRLTVSYPGSDGGDDITLSSGDTDTLHADFWNTWDQAELEELVETCLVAEERCGIVGGPGGR